MSEDNDMLCPWCLGELPGKPGQVAKCRHCGSDIHWGDGKPYKTKFQAAQPNPVVRDVPVKLKRTPRVPIEIENESGPESSFVMEDVSEIIGELHAYEATDTQTKQIVASHYGDDITWEAWWRGCPLWQKIFLNGIPIVAVSLISLVVTNEVMKANKVGPYKLVENYDKNREADPEENRPPDEQKTGITDVKSPTSINKDFHDIPTMGIMSLTAEQAADKVAKFKGGILSLEGLTSIDKDVAQELAKFRGEKLSLGLTSIDKDVAQELGNVKGIDLVLNGLTSINKDVARGLAKVEEGQLCLNGLTSIDKDVARELGMSRGSLSLGLTSIDKDVARELRTFYATVLISTRGLHLNRLTSISKDVAHELAKYHMSLHLNGLTSIDKEVAQELAEVNRGLFLNGLKSMDKDVAQELTKKFKNGIYGLSLDGLTSIDKEVARELAEWKGQLLSLNGLSINKDVARELANFEGEALYLEGLNSIDKEVAQELAKSRAGVLSLGLNSIDKEVAQELVKFEGENIFYVHLQMSDEERLEIGKSIPEVYLKKWEDKVKKWEDKMKKYGSE